MSDLPNLDAARAALAAFHESGRQIVVDRLSGRRKAAPMNRHLPNCERHLSDALAVVDALTARLDEMADVLEEERQKARRTGTLEERANIVAWLHKWAHNARAAGGFGKIGSSVLHEVAAQIEARR